MSFFRVSTLFPSSCKPQAGEPRREFKSFSSRRLRMIEDRDPASYDDDSITFNLFTKKDGKTVGVGGFTQIYDGWPELWYTITVKKKGYATEFAIAATRKWFRKSMDLHEAEVAGYTLTERERAEILVGRKRLVDPRIYANVQVGEKCRKAKAEKEANVKILMKAGFNLVETTGTKQHFVLGG